jgi:hypothetical protein
MVFRSVETAQNGAWLGGIVPYGYRKQDEKAQARRCP